MALTRATPVSFHQETPSAEWVIDHNLGDVTVANVVITIDGERHTILPNSIVHNTNQTVIKFTRPYSGSVRLV